MFFIDLTKHRPIYGCRLRIGAYSFFSRASDNSLILVYKHPKNCPTWHWSVSVRKAWEGEALWSFSRLRGTGQWHDYLPLPFGYRLSIGRQGYHLRPSRSAA